MPVAKQLGGDQEKLRSVERVIRTNEPLVAVEVSHIMRRQQNHVVLSCVQMPIRTIDDVGLGQGHAALGLELRNYELMAFAGVGLCRDVLGEESRAEQEQEK